MGVVFGGAASRSVAQPPSVAQPRSVAQPPALSLPAAHLSYGRLSTYSGIVVDIGRPSEKTVFFDAAEYDGHLDFVVRALKRQTTQEQFLKEVSRPGSRRYFPFLLYRLEAPLRLGGRDIHYHLFRVPSLRNVEHTAPYFHDGSAATLDDAINTMVKFQLGRPITDAQRRKVKAFLISLSGPVPAGAKNAQ